MLTGLILMAASVAAEPTHFQKILAAIGGHDGIPAAKWNEMTFLERVKIHDWTKELFIFAVFGVYFAIHFLGVRTNRKQVDRYMEAAEPVIAEQFAMVGCTPQMKIVKDSSVRYTTYASGRVNIESMLVRFYAIERQNLILNTIGLFFPSARSLEGLRDHALATLTPHDPTAIEPQIFAVVSKFVMQQAREDNYYLSLTRTTESPKLPTSLVFMAEHNEIIESLFTGALAEAITGAEDILEYFAVTDQGIDAPTEVSEVAPKMRVYLSVRYPSNKAQSEALAKLVDAAINAVDFMINKKPLRSEVARKIRASREEQIKKIEKAAEALKKEELEAKKAEERREQAKQQNKLSEKEERKLAKKQQEKEARKQRARMTRRQ